MSKNTNPFASKDVQILGKDYSSKSPLKWKGSSVVIADSLTKLSNKSDILTFSVGSASPGSVPNASKSLTLSGESQPTVVYSTLDLGKGDDRIVAKAKGGTPIGTSGFRIFLMYNGTTLNLGDGNDLIDTDNIAIRDGRVFGGKGNDKIIAGQYIDVEQWERKASPVSGLLDLDEGDDLIQTSVLQVRGRVFMGEGKDVITGLIDDHWTGGATYTVKPLIDLGAGDDLINLKYGQTTHYNRGEGIANTPDNPNVEVNYVEINGGDGFDRIRVTGGVYENVDINGIELMKYSANSIDFYYKLISIEEVSYV